MTDHLSIAIEMRPVEGLIPYINNARTHSEAQVDLIAGSMRQFGWTNPILIDAEGGIIAGHGRLLAARKLGLSEVPTICLSHLSEADRKAYILADNRLAELAGWDADLLRLEIGALQDMQFDVASIGFDAAYLEALFAEGPGPLDDSPSRDEARKTLAERFLIPPFTVFDMRAGYWQTRKRAWLALGIKSEVGRGDNLLNFSEAAMSSGALYKNKTRAFTKGRDLDNPDLHDVSRKILEQTSGKGTSIFDPVLCEIAYRWYCPPGGSVLDPFAGGSVRGIVAAKCGVSYQGIELRAEQVEANRANLEEIRADLGEIAEPSWMQGDSREALGRLEGEFDLVFSCPPYGDLEVYSDDPADISNMPWEEFLDAYTEIILGACALLKDDRFAVWVVGDVRSKEGNGHIRGLIPATIEAFAAAGLDYYNEAQIVTPVGSASIRASAIFGPARKLVRVHQTALVFVKGSAKAATAACGEIEIAEDFLDAFSEGSTEGSTEGSDDADD